MPTPQQKTQYTVEDAPAQSSQYSVEDAAPTDFSAPPNNTEGIYKMNGPTGQIGVPFSKVSAAKQAGHVLDKSDVLRYNKDAGSGYLTTQGDYLNSTTQHEPAPTTGLRSFSPTHLGNELVAGAADAIKSVPHMFDSGPDPFAGMTPEQRLQAHADMVANQGEQQVKSFAADPGGSISAHVGEQIPSVAAGVIGGKLLGAVASKGRSLLTGGTKAASALNDATLADNAKTGDSNQAATDDFNQKTANAQHETEGRELGYKQAVNTKTEDIAAKDAADQSKIATNYDQQLANTKTHNQQVLDKHKSVADRLTQQNEATNQTLGMRQQQQSDLDDMTQKYFAQEDAAKASAKGQENAAWQPWRDKMQDVMIDGKEIAEPLQKISTTSPEVGRVLRQLQPPPSEAPAGSNYAQDRAAIMQSLGYKGDYWELPESTRTTVDKIATSNGFEPDPIDFDPQPGKPIPVELVHRANSILQSYIRNGRFDGPILGEMKQVAKVLRASVSRASTEAGALPDLTAAREATMKYQDAFGRDRYQPQTQDDIREQQANPEAYKERDDEERLAKAAQFDQTLVDSFRGVKTARENLKKIPSEDTLRKGLKQVPAPPTVGDIRPGYSLLAEPSGPPAPAPSNSPMMRATQQVQPPERVGLPSPPQLSPTKTVGTEDIQAANKDMLADRAVSARSKGISRAASGLAAFDLIRNALHGNWEGAGIDIAARGGLAAGQYGYAKLLENPKVVDWLSKPTAAQAAMIDPTIARGLEPLLQQAKSKGIKISPAIAAAVSAHATKSNWYDQPSR